MVHFVVAKVLTVRNDQISLSEKTLNMMYNLNV